VAAVAFRRLSLAIGEFPIWQPVHHVAVGPAANGATVESDEAQDERWPVTGGGLR
jgi:hypothetical protein